MKKKEVLWGVRVKKNVSKDTLALEGITKTWVTADLDGYTNDKRNAASFSTKTEAEEEIQADFEMADKL